MSEADEKLQYEQIVKPTEVFYEAFEQQMSETTCKSFDALKLESPQDRIDFMMNSGLHHFDATEPLNSVSNCENFVVSGESKSPAVCSSVTVDYSGSASMTRISELQNFNAKTLVNPERLYKQLENDINAFLNY